MVQRAKQVFKVLTIALYLRCITLLKQSLSISLFTHKQVPKVHPLRTQYRSPISLRGKHSIAAICRAGAGLVYSIIGWRNASQAGVDRSWLAWLMLSAPPVKKLGRLYVRDLFVGCEGSCGEFSIVIWSQRGISAPAVASGYVNGLSQTNDVYE